MIFVYLVCGLISILLLTLGGLEIMEQKRFFNHAKKTSGRVVGTIGAAYKSYAQYGVDTSGYAQSNGTVFSATQYRSQTAGGGFLLVEFEDKKGDTYQVRSKQTFNEIPESVTIHYSATDMSQVVIDGHYSGSGKYFQIAGGVIFGLLPVALNMAIT